MSKKTNEIARFLSGGSVGTILLIAIMLIFPSRYQFGPSWLSTAFLIALAGLLLASAVSRLLLHRQSEVPVYTLVVIALMLILNALGLARLVGLLVYPRTAAGAVAGAIEGTRLLATAVSIWLTNVVAFAMLYWSIDGGSPQRRDANVDGPRDFAFPGDLRTPTFAEYLFLAFNTATAFSPTDVAPLSSRVRMMMMLESSVSLVALAIAAARAINILH